MTAESRSLSRRDDAERFHLLSTIITYPGLNTQDVRDRANEECQHDAFDPLPRISPQGIVGKLLGLERRGLVTSWRDFDGKRWEPTQAGREAWAHYEVTLNA